MEELTFEQAMQQLEHIVSQLENGEAALDESMKLFENGTKLAAQLSSMLDDAEQKVTMMTMQNGIEEEIPFDTEEEAE